MAITKQDVFRVASEIDAEGGKPSALEVRRRLGSGSYTTITAALKEWKDSADSQEVAELHPVPAEVMERLTLAAGDLWAVASRVALGVADEARGQWDVERKRLELAYQQAVGYADQVSASEAAAHQACGLLEAEKAELLRALGAETGLSSAAVADAERERKRADSAVAELTTLRVQVQAQQVALDAAQREIDALRGKSGSRSSGNRKGVGGSKRASPAAVEQSATDVH